VASAQAPTDEARIRAAAIGDACDVATLLEALGYPCSRAEAAERIAYVLGDQRQHLLVAERDGHTCGLVALDVRYSLTRGEDQARITALVVAPDSGRRGIGRRLLREVEGIARRAGATRIEVTSNAGRGDAHAFYHRCGYGDGSRHFFKRLGD
jgi:GNAT superfamily N-acetyltransferase